MPIIETMVLSLLALVAGLVFIGMSRSGTRWWRIPGVILTVAGIAVPLSMCSAAPAPDFHAGAELQRAAD